MPSWHKLFFVRIGAVTVSYVAVAIGTALVVAGVRLWSSDAFLEWAIQSDPRTRRRAIDDGVRRKARLGLRGALVVAFLAAGVLIAAGIRGLA